MSANAVQYIPAVLTLPRLSSHPPIWQKVMVSVTQVSTNVISVTNASKNVLQHLIGPPNIESPSGGTAS